MEDDFNILGNRGLPKFTDTRENILLGEAGLGREHQFVRSLAQLSLSLFLHTFARFNQKLIPFNFDIPDEPVIECAPQISFNCG